MRVYYFFFSFFIIVGCAEFEPEILKKSDSGLVRAFEPLPDTDHAHLHDDHLLDWPVALTFKDYQFGANAGQFVEFENKYFHAGQDILGEIGQEVISPVSGKIEGGYYSYIDDEKGHPSTKKFVSLKESLDMDEPPLWGERYFEVAVIDEEGTRFEFHHIDRDKLPSEIEKAILEGATVEAGQLVGHIVEWKSISFGSYYHHIHYNIIDKNGVYINPFYLSKPVKDETPPVVSQSYYRQKNETAKCSLSPGPFLKSFSKDSPKALNAEYLVVRASDHITGNSIINAPTKIHVEYLYNSGEVENLVYDFSQFLDPLSDIRETYFSRFCIGDPSYPINIRGSKNEDFYYKIPVKPDFKGKIVFTAYDFAGNSDEKEFTVIND